MENTYNDYLIMTPDVMEQIAKDYKKALEKNTKNSYGQIIELLSNVILKIGTLEKVCSKRFFNYKKEQIHKIHEIMLNLYSQFSNDKIVCETYLKTNYCALLKDIINELSEIIEVCLSNLKNCKDTLLDSCILSCLVCIKNSSSLFGECRYRSFF